MKEKFGNVNVQKSEERGKTDVNWLKSFHSFSFGNYHNPEKMGFRSLRVINEDFVGGGGGFPPHPHRDMEIITYVLQGALQHKDNMGNGSVMKPGDIQKMSAGTGVVHSEFNHSQTEPVHLLQIWIIPEKMHISPSYEQKTFSKEQKRNQFCLIGSKDISKGGVSIVQDVDIYATLLEKGQKIEKDIQPNRGIWVQMIIGNIEVNGKELYQGDAAIIENGIRLEIVAKENSEFLTFDLA